MKPFRKIECDEPMARHKGYIPCNKDCKTCHAAIITNENGDREHFPVNKYKRK